MEHLSLVHQTCNLTTDLAPVVCSYLEPSNLNFKTLTLAVMRLLIRGLDFEAQNRYLYEAIAAQRHDLVIELCANPLRLGGYSEKRTWTLLTEAAKRRGSSCSDPIGLISTESLFGVVTTKVSSVHCDYLIWAKSHPIQLFITLDTWVRNRNSELIQSYLIWTGFNLQSLPHREQWRKLLYTAASHGSRDTVALLLEQSAQEEPPLCKSDILVLHAVYSNTPDVIDYLLQRLDPPSSIIQEQDLCQIAKSNPQASEVQSLLAAKYST